MRPQAPVSIPHGDRDMRANGGPGQDGRGHTSPDKHEHGPWTMARSGLLGSETSVSHLIVVGHS